MPNYFPVVSGQALNIARVTLLAADILALFTTPVMLIPAPGANLFVDVLKASWRLNFNTVGYNTTQALLLSYGNISPAAATAIVTDANIVKDAATNIRSGVFPTPVTAVGAPVNQPIYVGLAGTNPTTGNSTLDVWVYYVINSN
jgi:hypothetical protein